MGSGGRALSRWENPARAIPPRIPPQTDPNQAEPYKYKDSEPPLARRPHVARIKVKIKKNPRFFISISISIFSRAGLGVAGEAMSRVTSQKRPWVRLISLPAARPPTSPSLFLLLTPPVPLLSYLIITNKNKADAEPRNVRFILLRGDNKNTQRSCSCWQFSSRYSDSPRLRWCS